MNRRIIEIEVFDDNAKREEQVVEFFKINQRCYENIKKEIDSEINMLQYITEGSRKNIIIGQILDKNLGKYISSTS